MVIRAGEPGVGFYSYGGTDLIADVFGWYTGTPAARVTYQPANQTPAPVTGVHLPDARSHRHTRK